MDDTLHLIETSKFVGKIRDLNGQRRFEASAVVKAGEHPHVRPGALIVVFDDMKTMAAIRVDRVDILDDENNFFIPLEGESDLQESLYEGEFMTTYHYQNTPKNVYQ
jgi:hypothetical protein